MEKMKDRYPITRFQLYLVLSLSILFINRLIIVLLKNMIKIMANIVAIIFACID